MENKHLLLKELNQALEIYSKSENKTNDSYQILFSPLQKANKILLENKISIFNLEQEENFFHQNLNGLEKLLTSSLKTRNIILESNLGLARKIANKYATKFPQLEYGDLKSEGVFGLLKAIGKFNPHLNVPFPHYALPVIDNYVKRNLNIYLRTIKLPVNFIFDYRLMVKFEDEFKKKFTKEPNDEELAKFMGKSVESVKNLKENNKKLYSLVSLDTTPMLQDYDKDYLTDNTKKYLIDYIADENSSFEDNVVNKITFKDFIKDFIKEYISKLPDREESILLEQLEGKTLEYLAFCPEEPNLRITASKKILTREGIRQISIRGIKKIRALKKIKELQNTADLSHFL